MHFQVYNTTEDDMLDCGACAFRSSWGSGDAALDRDMTPSLCLHVVLFPRAGRCKEQMATKATSCLPSSRDASGWWQQPPGLSALGTVQRAASLLGPALLTRSRGNLNQREGRAESSSSLILGNLFSKQFFLLAAFLM